MSTDVITWVGREFLRKGSCNQCEGCRNECLECPHGELVDDKQSCTIYNTRDQVCKECSDLRNRPVTHKGCIKFPEHPMVLRIRKGICSYTFSRTDQGSMDDLPGIKNNETYEIRIN